MISITVPPSLSLSLSLSLIPYRYVCIGVLLLCWNTGALANNVRSTPITDCYCTGSCSWHAILQSGQSDGKSVSSLDLLGPLRSVDRKFAVLISVQVNRPTGFFFCSVIIMSKMSVKRGTCFQVNTTQRRCRRRVDFP